MTRVVVVTGAASGIGYAIAERFALTRRYTTVLVDRADGVHAACKTLADSGGSVHCAQLDVSDEAAIVAFVKDTAQTHGGIDILVNNAGIHPKNKGLAVPFESISLEVWRQVMDVNLTSAFLLCREAIPLMKKTGWGRVVNMNSRAGRMYAESSGAHYATSKAGMIGLTRTLAGEASPFGITVNGIAPGRVRTPLSNEGGEALHERYAKTIPVRRIGTVAEVAALTDFLSSDEAGYITGTITDINGGAFMG